MKILKRRRRHGLGKFLCQYFIISAVFLIPAIHARAQSSVTASVDIVWQQQQGSSGEIQIKNGQINRIEWVGVKGVVKGSKFQAAKKGTGRLRVHLSAVNIQPGPNPTLITVLGDQHSFTFILRDVQASSPIFIPRFGVAVLPSSDKRDYAAVAASVSAKHLSNKLEEIDEKPEVTFDNLDPDTRDQYVPTWLGTSRDIRIFQVNERNNQPAMTRIIYPKLGGAKAIDFKKGNAKYNNVRYGISFGRGESTAPTINRRLEEGVLPILHSELVDEDISYRNISFVVNDMYGFDELGKTGTNYLVASNALHGANFTEEQLKVLQKEIDKELSREDQTVFCWQLRAVNTTKVPRYAWFSTPFAIGTKTIYDKKTAICAINNEFAFGSATLNGKPVPNEEMAVLVQPGDSAIYEVYLFHQPVTYDRVADFVKKETFDQRYKRTKEFWQSKLDDVASVQLPEKRLQEMIYAGLLHMDLNTYGKASDSVLAATIGVYPPIGTESSPIIQFYLSMGWFEKARLSLQYFLNKQHDDGLMQNFGEYMVETGGALWSMGEYYRYTRDEAWLQKNKDKILKSVNYLINWRNQNKQDSLVGRGYGMIKGKVADPPDHFHQYMLNGYAYLGVKRIAESFANSDPSLSQKLNAEANAWKEDILKSLRNSIAYAPVVPLGNGTWCPTVPPWTETIGPRALYLVAERYRSHGTYLVPDAMLGPLYLIFCEVLDPKEPVATMMLDYHSELYYMNNTTLSQPYYSRHNWVQLKRGMVKPFLKTFYNTFASMADRETYTFWEHIFQVSVHKTHEEGWFLMELRWMLYHEEEDMLHLLSMIPRNWMENGKTLRLKDVRTYFGPVSLEVESKLDQNYIQATVTANDSRHPKEITIRLPHPKGDKAVRVTGGVYDEKSETIRVKDFNGQADVRVYFK